MCSRNYQCTLVYKECSPPFIIRQLPKKYFSYKSPTEVKKPPLSFEDRISIPRELKDPLLLEDKIDLESGGHRRILGPKLEPLNGNKETVYYISFYIESVIIYGEPSSATSTSSFLSSTSSENAAPAMFAVGLIFDKNQANSDVCLGFDSSSFGILNTGVMYCDSKIKNEGNQKIILPGAGKIAIFITVRVVDNMYDVRIKVDQIDVTCHLPYIPYIAFSYLPTYALVVPILFSRR